MLLMEHHFIFKMVTVASVASLPTPKTYYQSRNQVYKSNKQEVGINNSSIFLDVVSAFTHKPHYKRLHRIVTGCQQHFRATESFSLCLKTVQHF